MVVFTIEVQAISANALGKLHDYHENAQLIDKFSVSPLSSAHGATSPVTERISLYWFLASTVVQGPIGNQWKYPHAARLILKRSGLQAMHCPTCNEL